MYPAMKKFLITILIFVLPLIVCAWLLDRFFSDSLRQSRNGEFGVWNDIYNGKVNDDLIIYGGSRAWVHFDPKIMTDSLGISVYNVGLNGHNFLLQNLRHRLLLKYNEKPEVIIHAVDIMTLGKRPDLFNLEQFLPYMMDDTAVANAIAGYEGYDYLDYRLPLMRYSGKWKTVYAALKLRFGSKNYTPDRIKGYQGKDMVWNSDFEKAKEEINEFNMDLDPATVRLFEKYIRECREKNIRLIFVSPPEYIEGQLFVKNYDEIMNVFRKFSHDYSVPYYDYTKDTMSYSKRYFYNSTHMNKLGAELFTRKLVVDMKKDKVLDNL
ncbi:MAG: Uncharacterized protein FD166_2692 [Bacteroidetes bacterium]|nr:MAG: Uncharacterized protein FD166_2692 [Bacteroidota bacterium]